MKSDPMQDPDFRYWKRVSAIVSVAVAVCFVGMLAMVGYQAPPGPTQVSAAR